MQQQPVPVPTGAAAASQTALALGPVQQQGPVPVPTSAAPVAQMAVPLDAALTGLRARAMAAGLQLTPLHIPAAPSPRPALPSGGSASHVLNHLFA